MKTARTTKLVLAMAVLAVFLSSYTAEAQLSGPILGYMRDPESSAVRAINGIPGASTFGKAVEVERRNRKVAFSIERDYALAVMEDTGEVAVISDLSHTASLVVLPGVYAGGDVLAISPDGSTAAIVSFDTARLQVVAGLPSAPVVRFEEDLSFFGEQKLSAVAVNRSEQVLGAFSDGGLGAVYLFAAGRAPRFIANVGTVSGIRFPVEGDLAVFADRGWNQVILLQDLSTTATPIQLATSADGIANPVGIVLSRDARTAYVANAGSATVTAASLSGGVPRDLACACELTTMQSLTGDSVFALTEKSDQPVVLFDGGAEEPRFLIVPPRQPDPVVEP